MDIQITKEDDIVYLDKYIYFSLYDYRVGGEKLAKESYIGFDFKDEYIRDTINKRTFYFRSSIYFKNGFETMLGYNGRYRTYLDLIIPIEKVSKHLTNKSSINILSIKDGQYKDITIYYKNYYLSSYVEKCELLLLDPFI